MSYICVLYDYYGYYYYPSSQRFRLVPTYASLSVMHVYMHLIFERLLSMISAIVSVCKILPISFFNIVIQYVMMYFLLKCIPLTYLVSLCAPYKPP